MSYILEALKKSEQERRRGDVPDLQTVHMPVFVQPKSHAWLYAVIVVLLLALAFALGMIISPKDEQAVVEQTVNIPPVVTTEPVKSEPPAIHQEAAAVTLQTEAANNTESRVIVETTSADVLEQPPSLEMDTVPYLQDLPALVQQAIPDMTFAGHVYSSNPAQRSVIINGHAMGEGELVIDRLRVEQITRNGVVFNFDGQLFRMDILQDWSFN